MPHKILIIDDSEDTEDLVRFGLFGEPVELLFCSDSSAAVALTRSIAPDLLLLDVDMPGIDGFEVCRRLKADPVLSPIPVVFLTGASSTSEKLRGLDLGAMDYVTKPFDPVELRARVRAALRTKSLMDRLADEAVNLRAQAEVLRLVARDAPLLEVQRRLIDMAEAEYEDAIAAVVLLRHGNLELVAPSMPQPARVDVNRHIVSLTASLCSALASTPETFGECSILEDARWNDARPGLREAGITGCWYSLLRSGGGYVLGMFCLFHKSLKSADEAARVLMDKHCSLLSIAVDHRQLTEVLEHRAEHDALTGLPNRVLLEERLRESVSQAENTDRLVGVIFIDVDRFKLINDTMGHLVGDLLLCQMAERLTQAVGEVGTLARLGGDEFAVVQPQLHNCDDAVRSGQRILDAMRVPFQIGGHELFVTVSVGLSIYPLDGHDTTALKKKADSAMYMAKQSGRNALQCFDRSMDESVGERLDLQNALRRAVDSQSLKLHYQPQVDRQGNMVCVEALLRWTDPVRGSISPATFIPLAEESGLIIPLGAWVLREAARQAREWRLSGQPGICVAVNVSMLQFAQPGFVDFVEQTMREFDMPPGALELELTESLLMKNPAAAAEKLRRLKRAGVMLAIDDFGIGYSSLAYLRELAVDALKIDRSFVTSIGKPYAAGTDEHREADEAVVRAIASMAHSLRKIVVAEGVETPVQQAFLAEIGCDRMQGYLFGRPVPPDEMVKRFRTQDELIRKAG